MNHRTVIVVVAGVLACTTFAYAKSRYKASKADRAGVRAAILDYVEGVYTVDPKRIERSVHKDLAKVGYSKQDDGTWKTHPMDYQRLYELAATYNKENRFDPKKQPKKVEIFEVLDKTASAKVTARWGIDYFHLAKHGDKWVIMNVLWQSEP